MKPQILKDEKHNRKNNQNFKKQKNYFSLMIKPCRQASIASFQMS
jgi:hypothetical protein